MRLASRERCTHAHSGCSGILCFALHTAEVHRHQCLTQPHIAKVRKGTTRNSLSCDRSSNTRLASNFPRLPSSPCRLPCGILWDSLSSQRHTVTMQTMHARTCAHENRCDLFWGHTHIQATEEGGSKEGKRHSSAVSRDGGASDARRGEAR